MNIQITKPGKAILPASLLFLFSGVMTPANATLNIADIPLFITSNLAPNVIITLDDSLSMPVAAVPDSIDSQQNNKRYKDYKYNALYYNPNVLYTPPPKFDNNGLECTNDPATNPATCYPNASFTAAPINGFDTSQGTTTNSSSACNPAGVSGQKYSPVNLSSNYAVSYSYNPKNETQSCGNADAGTTSTPVNYGPASCNIDFDNNGSSDRIQINSGCSGWATNLVAGAVVTISGASSRNGNYTVASVSGSNIYITPTNPWGSDVNNQNVTLSWSGTATTSSYAAYYYRFYSDAAVSAPGGCTAGDRNDDDCYVKVVVGSASDITPGTVAQKQQNFANWYSYYRTRNLATVSSAMRAFDGVDQDVRVAWQALNSGTGFGSDSTAVCNAFGTNCRGWDGVSTDNRMRRLNGVLASGKTHKQELYEWLARFPVAGSTYLRAAAERAGKYLQGTVNVNHPLAEDPQYTLGTVHACRRNVHIVMTDGGWCADAGQLTVTYGNANSSSTTLPTGETLPDGSTSFTPGAPYSDSNNTSLADISFYYWATDLQPTLANNVSEIYRDPSGTDDQQWRNAANDPATWQHLNTYTVGLGLTRSLADGGLTWSGDTYSGDYTNLKSGSKSWPTFTAPASCPPNDSTMPGLVADLWHAALSSRGEFFSSEDPDSVTRAFQSILTQVTTDSSSSAALATNSTQTTGAALYQAQFDPASWSGHLYAYDIDNSTGKVIDTYWDAAEKLPAHGSRNIFTYDGSNGQPFTSCATNLSAAQKLALDTDIDGVVDNKCTDRLNWLRGDTSKEKRFTGGIFRNRAYVLGDLINSDPNYEWKDDYGYGSADSVVPGKDLYESFVAGKDLRSPAVYVGANDGMLHAFNAKDDSTGGGELFAYVPASVYGNLSALTSPNYQHKYFVDGSPEVGDAYLGGGWKTILVGGLKAGGKSYFALDVTNPATFSQSNVKWEFPKSTTAVADKDDLGFSFSQPLIVPVKYGVTVKWVAIFGNGYNSTNGNAYLYVLDLDTGDLLGKLSTSSDTNNGLSTPEMLDADGDKIVDYIYAGDLQGDLWKFDFTGTWPTAGTKIFDGDFTQPITAQPKVSKYDGVGNLVFFGTGQYLEADDIISTSMQTFYAVQDNGSATAAVRADLQAQYIEDQQTGANYEVRSTSDNTVDYAGGKRGWYLDLIDPVAGNQGERVIFKALLQSYGVFFVTLIPSGSDPCIPGGTSWLMGLDAKTGARFPDPVFDLNSDNEFSNDTYSDGVSVSGLKTTIGITTSPIFLEKGGDGGGGGDAGGGQQGVLELSGSSGDLESLGLNLPGSGGGGGTPGTFNRVYWMQIQ